MTPRILSALTAILLTAPLLAEPASYAGKYSGTDMEVQLTADGTAYRGTIHKNGQDFPVIGEPREGDRAKRHVGLSGGRRSGRSAPQAAFVPP